MKKVVSLVQLGLIFACAPLKDKYEAGSNLSSFSFGNFQPESGEKWEKVKIDISNTVESKSSKSVEVAAKDYKNHQTVKVTKGKYRITLEYRNKDGKLIYDTCSEGKSLIHDINSKNYQALIPVCKTNSSTSVGTVPVTSSDDLSNILVLPVEKGVETGKPTGTVDTGKPTGTVDTGKPAGTDGSSPAGKDAILKELTSKSWAACEPLTISSTFKSLQSVYTFGSDRYVAVSKKHKVLECKDPAPVSSGSLSIHAGFEIIKVSGNVFEYRLFSVTDPDDVFGDLGLDPAEAFHTAKLEGGKLIIALCSPEEYKNGCGATAESSAKDFSRSMVMTKLP